ncbi:alpha/beta hydrolase [Brucella gallinifaecis]|uniref:alpha/beta hydrolase n=1 Tax=Brucella gallinifaecis TaxID=215590 RepID=UPI0023608CB5|nr:alpha/beta hydrolase [Brucella gallinifaecis]
MLYRLTILPSFLFACMIPTLAMAEPVQIDGPKGSLVGELISVANAHDIVVIIPGSGPTDRDGNSPQMGLQPNTYKLLAEGLEKAGISSLRIDKRGFYGSQAAIDDPNDVTIEAYADDVLKWMARASEISPCVWIAGHSEGGLVALVAARSNPQNLCGLILLAASGRPIGRLLVEQFHANPANTSFISEVEIIVGELEAGRTVDAQSIPTVLQPLFSTGLQRYMIDLFSYDPVEIASHWKGPVLVVQGTADIQVKQADADRLAGAMPQAVLKSLNNATHVLKEGIQDQPFITYTNGALPLHSELMPTIVDFLQKSRTAD